MKEAMKTKGAWVIRVMGPDVGRGADIGRDKCSPSPSGGIPYCNEQNNTTVGKEESYGLLYLLFEENGKPARSNVCHTFLPGHGAQII